MTADELLKLVRDDLGLPFTRADFGSDLDTVISWDSLQMLRLATAIKSRTGRAVRLAALLECRTLAGVLAVIGGETIDD